MSIEIIPICYDCNEELSNWDRFLNRKYPNTLGYTLCSQCEKRREEKTIIKKKNATNSIKRRYK